jgi:hypothetical protein
MKHILGSPGPILFDTIVTPGDESSINCQPGAIAESSDDNFINIDFV